MAPSYTPSTDILVRDEALNFAREHGLKVLLWPRHDDIANVSRKPQPTPVDAETGAQGLADGQLVTLDRGHLLDACHRALGSLQAPQPIGTIDGQARRVLVSRSLIHLHDYPLITATSRAQAYVADPASFTL